MKIINNNKNMTTIKTILKKNNKSSMKISKIKKKEVNKVLKISIKMIKIKIKINSTLIKTFYCNKAVANYHRKFNPMLHLYKLTKF